MWSLRFVTSSGMKDKTLQLAILTVAGISLLGLLIAILMYQAAMQAINHALVERNKVGFVVGAGGVV